MFSSVWGRSPLNLDGCVAASQQVCSVSSPQGSPSSKFHNTVAVSLAVRHCSQDQSGRITWHAVWPIPQILWIYPQWGNDLIGTLRYLYIRHAIVLNRLTFLLPGATLAPCDWPGSSCNAATVETSHEPHETSPNTRLNEINLAIMSSDKTPKICIFIVFLCF